MRSPVWVVVLAACAGAPKGPPALPNPDGWGLHVLADRTAPDGTRWVGTYGQGIYRLPPGAAAWEHLLADTSGTSISWDFVHAFAFQGDTVWYGTVGNGWGRSTDHGRTWHNWTYDELGPEYQYVTPQGILVRGDTVYVATADGVKVTWDGGTSWRVITDSAGATTARDPVWGRIGNQYVLAIASAGDRLYVSHVHGVEVSTDGGRSWTFVTPSQDQLYKIRRFVAPGEAPDRIVRFVTTPAFPGRPPLTPLRAPWGDSAAVPLHLWFARPIAEHDQPFIDQTYRYGSTMGGNFQQHQGVEFNNADGTPVHAIGAGRVVFAGPAEAGALTVAIRHDSTLTVGDSAFAVFSVYYHNSRLETSVGRRVDRGDLIARVGNTGRATNDHLHLEVHAVPVALADSVSLVVNPDERYPHFTTNPELWIAPLPGTGVVAGQVWDADGHPVQQARVYGFQKPLPSETPFSYAETYGDRARGTPAYREHFAISDIPAGDHVLGVEIDGKRVYRRVNVLPGRVTWVEFRP